MFQNMRLIFWVGVHVRYDQLATGLAEIGTASFGGSNRRYQRGILGISQVRMHFGMIDRCKEQMFVRYACVPMG